MTKAYIIAECALENGGSAVIAGQLIDAAKSRIYFAIYTFTLSNIADALVAAKKRGVEVRGIMDSEQSANSYGAPITAKLLEAGIRL